MLEERSMPSETANTQNEGRVVIDAVHERFRQARVRCDDCNGDIAWDEAAIRSHYNRSHPSNRHCRYCGGKVFTYRKVTPVDSDQKPQQFVYHRCEHNEQMDM